MSQDSVASPSELFTSILGSPRINGLPVREILGIVKKERRQIDLDLPVRIIDHIFSVCRALDCEPKTSLVAIHLLSAYMKASSSPGSASITMKEASNSVHSSVLACILIASKTHDHAPVSVLALQRCASFSLDRADIIAAELRVLNLAGFEMHFPTPYDVIEVILTAFGVIDTQSAMFLASVDLLSLVYSRPAYINGDWPLLGAAIVHIAADIVHCLKPILKMVESLLKLKSDAVIEMAGRLKEDCFKLENERIVRYSP